MEDRVVHNIRLSFTAQDDYRFQVKIAWDPPVYPYKNVTLYYVWNWKGDNKFISFHNTVSVDKFITANVADLILSTQKHQTHSSHDLNSAKISSKKDVFVGLLVIVSSWFWAAIHRVRELPPFATIHSNLVIVAFIIMMFIFQFHGSHFNYQEFRDYPEKDL